jgi:hypothetical protein
VDAPRDGIGKRGLAVLASPEQREALEVDLTLRGVPADLGVMPVGRIGALWQQLVRDAHSATARAAGGDGFSHGEHLLFLAVDELRVANWLRTKDGVKGRNRPPRLSPLARPAGRRSGRTDRAPHEVAALLARYGPARP